MKGRYHQKELQILIGCKALLSASLAKSHEYVSAWFGDFRYYGRGTDVKRLLKPLTLPSNLH